MLLAARRTFRDGALWAPAGAAMFAACFGTLASPAASALELHGVLVPERITIAPAVELVLNGAGVRTEASLHRYVAALYLRSRRTAPKDILADAGAKRISITLLRDTRAVSLTRAIVENLTENHTVSELESLKAPLDELVALINRLGAARKGASIILDYLPGEGTSVTLNGGAAAKPVRGDDLHHALLRVWLGEDPVDRNLRRALLGQSGGEIKPINRTSATEREASKHGPL